MPKHECHAVILSRGARCSVRQNSSPAGGENERRRVSAVRDDCAARRFPLCSAAMRNPRVATTVAPSFRHQWTPENRRSSARGTLQACGRTGYVGPSRNAIAYFVHFQYRTLIRFGSDACNPDTRERGLQMVTADRPSTPKVPSQPPAGSGTWPPSGSPDVSQSQASGRGFGSGN
jgi:hypothetical protein